MHNKHIFKLTQIGEVILIWNDFDLERFLFTFDNLIFNILMNTHFTLTTTEIHCQ